MLLDPCPLNTMQFTFGVGMKRIFTEASDLGFHPGQVPGGRLYDDACDVGITLTSHHTGFKTHWARAEDVVVEGEVIAWVFRPIPESVRKVPRLEGWEVHILND